MPQLQQCLSSPQLTSMCSSPRKPHRKPAPSALLFSLRTVTAGKEKAGRLGERHAPQQRLLCALYACLATSNATAVECSGQQMCWRTGGIVQSQPLHGRLQLLKAVSRQRENACTGAKIAPFVKAPSHPSWHSRLAANEQMQWHLEQSCLSVAIASCICCPHPPAPTHRQTPCS